MDNKMDNKMDNIDMDNIDMDNIDYVSHSRLQVYNECSEKYNKQYVQKLQKDNEIQDYFEIGSLVHEVLEDHLDPTTSLTLEDSYKLALPLWLKKHSLSFNPKDIFNISAIIGELMYKASARYKGEDAIRNKGGTPPADLRNYPPQSWTTALQKAGITTIKNDYDTAAGIQAPFFITNSLCYLVAEVYLLTQYFQLPEWYDHTIYVEFPISTDDTNRVLFPGTDDLYIRGFMDWVFKTKEGQIVIADHKTSKGKPKPNDVLHHSQLNLYAYVYSELFGYWPDVLGIHHVRTNDFIMAAVDKEIVFNNLKRYEGIVRGINSKTFITHHPDDFNSPCITKDWRSKKVSKSCPFLINCWPTYVEGMSLESQLVDVDFDID